jgi:phosphatidylglycerol:prolipoprotein diacylglycerol transferase
MRPVLLSPFGIDIPAYFAMLAIGLTLATWLGSRWVARLGMDKEVIWDLGLAMTIAGVIGSRILHVLADGYFWDYVHLCTDPGRVSWHISRGMCLSRDVNGLWDAAASVCHPRERNCFAWAAFWAGGLTFYGGLLGAAAYAIYFLRREKFPFLVAADMAGFVIPLGLAWGRMGCFLAGCCFGHVCNLPWATRFPALSPASEMQARTHQIATEGIESLPVHPTQLYESLGSLAIALIAYLVVVPRKRFHGQVFVFFVVGYGILRTAIEALREDDRGGFLGLSTSQLISLAMIAGCVPLWNWAKKRASEMAARPATT